MEETEPESYEYEHKKFPPGLTVYVDPAILEIHEKSKIAARSGITQKGIAYKNLEPFEDQTAKVLVDFGDEIGKWYVEEEYVRIDED